MSSVQNPLIIPFNPGWFSSGFPYWIIIAPIRIPNILRSIIPYNHQAIYLGVSIVMGVHPIAGWFTEENPNLEMDDDWGYPYFRKPPYELVLLLCSSSDNTLCLIHF